MNHFIDLEIPNADLNRTLHAFLDAKDQLHFSELAFIITKVSAARTPMRQKPLEQALNS